MVANIDQLILLLSILKMQNLARKGSGFELRRVLIIISCGLMNIEKREDGLQVTHTEWNWDSKQIYIALHAGFPKPAHLPDRLIDGPYRPE